MAEKVARNGGGIEEFSMPWEGVKERKLWNKKNFFILETQPIFTWGVARKLVWKKMQKSEARFWGVVTLHRQTFLMNVERDSTDHEDLNADYIYQQEDTDYTVFYSTDIYHSYGGITSITTTNLTIGLLYHFLKKIVSPKNSDFSSLPLHCRQGRKFCREAGWNRCELWEFNDERWKIYDVGWNLQTI